MLLNQRLIWKKHALSLHSGVGECLLVTLVGNIRQKY